MEKKRIAHNKLTQSEAIQKLVEIHGNTYGYDKSIYIDSLTPMDIYCFKHEEYFPQTFKAHKKSGCPKCGRERQIESAKKGQDQFIKELKELYGDIFDLSKLDYKNTKTDIELGCQKHGFFKRKPSDLLEGFSCQRCKLEKSKYNNRDLFIEESIKLFGDITDHSKVEEISAKTKVELHCKIHNHSFTLTVGNRLSGQKCPKCAEENYSAIRTKSTEKFVNQAQEIYKDLHDYTKTNYRGCQKEIEVRCKEHDYIFKTLPQNYLAGYGCKKCRVEKTKYRGGHHNTKEEYVKLANGKVTYLYLILCYDEYENFYKIGKTFRGLDKRFTKSNMPYKYKKVFIYESDAETIWDLEKILHKKYKPYKYKTDKLFNGYSECYTLDLPTDEIIKL